MRLRLLFGLTTLTTVALGAAACTDGSGHIRLALAGRAGASSPVQAQAAGDSVVLALGNDTVIIRSVEMVLREVELKRVEDATGCTDSEETGGDDDECEEIETGPMLVDVGLSGIEHVVTVDLPAGSFDELEFKIHKPRNDNADDQAFITAHPDFQAISIRVKGTFSAAGTRSDFTFTSDLDAEQEIELDPPLNVASDGSVNLTIRFDIATWFLNAAHTALVSPTTANAGGINESLVEQNIRASIRAFRDDDGDGEDDEHEGDDGDGGHSGPGIR